MAASADAVLNRGGSKRENGSKCTRPHTGGEIGRDSSVWKESANLNVNRRAYDCHVWRLCRLTTPESEEGEVKGKGRGEKFRRWERGVGIGTHSLWSFVDS